MKKVQSEKQLKITYSFTDLDFFQIDMSDKSETELKWLTKTPNNAFQQVLYCVSCEHVFDVV